MNESGIKREIVKAFCDFEKEYQKEKEKLLENYPQDTETPYVYNECLIRLETSDERLIEDFKKGAVYGNGNCWWKIGYAEMFKGRGNKYYFILTGRDAPRCIPENMLKLHFEAVEKACEAFKKYGFEVVPVPWCPWKGRGERAFKISKKPRAIDLGEPIKSLQD